MLQQRASDVRIREIDLSQVVTGASSAVLAGVVFANKGTLEKMRFTSGQEVLDQYHDQGSPNLSINVRCVLDFFEEGEEAWLQRVVGTGYRYAATVVYRDGQDIKALPVPGGVADPENVDLATLVPANAEPFLLVWPKQGPGSYGDNYAISIESTNVEAPANTKVESQNTGGSLVAGTYTYFVSCLTEDGETLTSAPATIVIAGSEVTFSNVVSWDPVPYARGYRVYGRSAANASDPAIGLVAEIGQGTFEYVDTGIPVDAQVKPITDPADAAAPSPTFVFSIYDTRISTVNSQEAYECTLLPALDGDNLPLEIEERVSPFSLMVNVRNEAPTMLPVPVIKSVALTEMAGGDSGAAPTSFDVIRAWETFDNKELYQINLLCNTGHSTPIVQHAMDKLAQARQDCVGLLDTPSAQQQWQQAINYRNMQLNLNSSYSALFCPDVEEADSVSGRVRWVPFSGWAAALCARTDRVANPSYSIAGLNRGLVPVLRTRYSYTDPQASAMFRAQVNYTRTFIGQGIALWEQKTLQAKDSALSWLSVRRIVNVIKTSLYRYGLYILQEPNDEFTGRQLVGSFSDYLELVKNARGISRYTVVSDSSNNPAALINSGIRKVTVVIVPIIPIHELQLDIAISKEGVSFQETLRTLNGG